MTIAYSNAVLLVVLTNVSDFAKRLDLPIPQPITLSQVQTFKPHPFNNYIGGVLTLTNGDRFFQDGHGYIDLYYGYENYLMMPDDMDWEKREEWIARFYGPVNMTTNEMIEFGRDALRKLGFDPKRLNADRPPETFSGPYSYKGKTVPFCNIDWQDESNNFINININAEKKQIVRLSLISTNCWRPDPKLSVEPELESDYRKRMQGRIFVNTNAPKHWPGYATNPAPQKPLTPISPNADMRQPQDGGKE